MTSTPEHWDAAYAQGDTARGWYQREARISMRLLREQGVNPDDSIVDIGGGASVLVDDLLDAGFHDITVLDHSTTGLDIARQRLGGRAADVTWVCGDLLAWKPARTYDVWHDRAVLHFLLTSEDQQAYADVLRSATHAGSLVIIGVFSHSGPPMCSGLPVRRYDEGELRSLLGPAFATEAILLDEHVKPDGTTQDYIWWAARRLPGAAL